MPLDHQERTPRSIMAVRKSWGRIFDFGPWSPISLASQKWHLNFSRKTSYGKNLHPPPLTIPKDKKLKETCYVIQQYAKSIQKLQDKSGDNKPKSSKDHTKFIMKKFDCLKSMIKKVRILSQDLTLKSSNTILWKTTTNILSWNTSESFCSNRPRLPSIFSNGKLL